MAEPRREVGIKQPARRVDSLRDLLLDTRHLAQRFQICASAPWPCPVSRAQSTLMLSPPVLGTLFSWPSLAVFSAHGSPSFQVWHSHAIDSRSTFPKEADTQLNLEGTVLCEIIQFKRHVYILALPEGPRVDQLRAWNYACQGVEAGECRGRTCLFNKHKAEGEWWWGLNIYSVSVKMKTFAIHLYYHVFKCFRAKQCIMGDR